MQYKVLALDLDGTLTNSDKIITPRTKAIIPVDIGGVICDYDRIFEIGPPSALSRWPKSWNWKNTVAAF